MPPAYPAPSPHGNRPLISDSQFSFLIILTGLDVLLSTPENTASSISKPLMCFAKPLTPSLIESLIVVPKTFLKLAKL